MVANCLREGFPDGAERFTVLSGLLEEVGRYEGFWWSRTQVELPPARVSEIRDQFIHRVTLPYLEAAIPGQADRPLDFVATYMVEEVNFDTLTATWLFLMQIDAIAIDVLLHTLVTGCPLHRLVTYWLISGRG